MVASATCFGSVERERPREDGQSREDLLKSAGSRS